jgi:aerobic-type carbon monoxide dehydrogenase small subunit (CoxS/CutS family)
MNRADATAVTAVVNGRQLTREIEPRTLLSDFLREDCGLTGTHVACEHGVCGACTVIVDGHAVRSCLTFAVQVDGGEVETVEALGRPDDLHELQEAFRRCHGIQCGFCTPGILMALVAAQREQLPIDEVEREILSGHICRCTGYAGIRTAVRSVWGMER